MPGRPATWDLWASWAPGLVKLTGGVGSFLRSLIYPLQRTIAISHCAVSSACHPESDHSQHTGYSSLLQVSRCFVSTEKHLGEGDWLNQDTNSIIIAGESSSKCVNDGFLEQGLRAEILLEL